ncbi:hypothetical protein QF037_008294 [Streptomyces canus]|uniref:hypothetical protein n=1 Tax=Streptomyces canus TaxID=58343 RepID=UPI002786867B|nr:hypothetical protein [Streptomyces canus]MDQ0603949.1 hypothetical protein [Streptomyces canus]
MPPPHRYGDEQAALLRPGALLGPPAGGAPFVRDAREVREHRERLRPGEHEGAILYVLEARVEQQVAVSTRGAAR